MTSDELQYILKQAEIEDEMMKSLQLSAQVSIEFISKSDPETMDLFYLLGMLPGGISPKELNEIWSKVLDYKAMSTRNPNKPKLG